MRLRVTRVEKLDVDVSWEDVLTLIEERLGLGKSFVQDGLFYEFDRVDYHSGDPEFKSPRPATQDELNRWNAWLTLKSLR